MTEQPDGARPAPVNTIVCPHCTGLIALSERRAAPGEELERVPVMSGTKRVAAGNAGANQVEQWVVTLLGRGLTVVIGERGVIPRWMIIGGGVVLVIVLVGLILVGGTAPAADQEPALTTETGHAGEMERTSAQSVPGLAAGGATGPAQEEIIAMLRAYNAAETEAAETLEFAIIEPFLDPDGPFFAERHAAMQERIMAFRPHTTILEAWALGTMTITDTTATVVTQEVWSNQERDAVGKTQARVRVTYALRFDDARETWVIVSSDYTEL